MNFSAASNTTGDVNYTVTYSDVNEALRAFGSDWFWDVVYLFIAPPISLLGFLTNAYCTYVFSRNEFKSLRLYSLLQALTINSSLICFFTMFDFAFYSRRFIWFTNTFASNFYNCYIHEPITNVAYFCGSVLNILIMVERITIFSKLYKILPKVSEAWKIFLGVYIACAIMDIPYFLVEIPDDILVYIRNEQRFIRFFYFDESAYSKTSLGRGLTYTVYLLRDVLTVCFMVFLTCVYVVRVKQHFSKHWNRVSVVSVPISDPLSTGKAKELASSKSNQLINIRKIDRKARFIIALCVLESLEHGMTIVSIIYGNLNRNYTAQFLYRLADLFIILRNAFNFPVFVVTNKHFKTYLLKHLTNSCVFVWIKSRARAAC